MVTHQSVWLRALGKYGNVQERAWSGLYGYIEEGRGKTFLTLFGQSGG